jgi:hypothetical protein
VTQKVEEILTQFGKMDTLQLEGIEVTCGKAIGLLLHFFD